MWSRTLPDASERTYHPPVHTPALFVSDAHLQPTDGPTSALVQDLHALFRHAGDTASSVFILGDLFDFWFEYRYGIIRQYLPTLRVLGELSLAGVPVTFIPGNHDTWVGSALEDWGVRVMHGPARLTLQGRRTVLAHGDGIGVTEPWTNAFRTVVRHPVTIEAYRLLGPDVGVPLALSISRLSRRFSGKKRIDPEKVRARVLPALVDESTDLVVLGHYHQPSVLTDGRVEFALIADFLHRRSFARLEGGVFELCVWGAEGTRSRGRIGA